VLLNARAITNGAVDVYKVVNKAVIGLCDGSNTADLVSDAVATAVAQVQSTD